MESRYRLRNRDRRRTKVRSRRDQCELEKEERKILDLPLKVPPLDCKHGTHPN